MSEVKDLTLRPPLHPAKDSSQGIASAMPKSVTMNAPLGAGLGSSPPKPPNQKQNHRKHDTNHNRGSQWKIKSSVLTPIQNVPRQPPQRQACPSQQHDNAPDHYQSYTEDHQHPSHLRHAFECNSGDPTRPD